MKHYCSECNQIIKRKIRPSDVARRKHLFCTKKCHYIFFKKNWRDCVPSDIKQRMRAGISRGIKEGRRYRQNLKPPKNCPAKVDTCELCPYPDCII